MDNQWLRRWFKRNQWWGEVVIITLIWVTVALFVVLLLG